MIILPKKITHSLLFIPTVVALNLSLPGITWSDGSSGKVTAPLKPDVPYAFVVHQGRSIKIERDIYNSFKARIDIRGQLIQSSGTCPPFCLQPLQLAMPVDTVGEAEIVDFMLTTMRDNKGVLVDVRSKRSFESSTIPGSVNYFIQDIQKGLGDTKFDAMLEALSAKPRGETGWLDRQLERFGLKGDGMLTDTWDFTTAKVLILWTNSANDRSAALAIENLLAVGYPAAKLKWYRGGLASWQYWGFNTVRTVKRN